MEEINPQIQKQLEEVYNAAPATKQTPFYEKGILSLINTVVASALFAFLFFFGINLYLRLSNNIGFDDIFYNPGFLTLPTGLGTITVAVSTFLGTFALYSIKPKRIYIVMLLIPLIILLLLIGFGYLIYFTSHDEGGLIGGVFIYIAVLTAIPLLLFNFIVAKILYSLRFDHPQAKLWIGITIGIIFVFAGTIVYLTFTNSLRTKTIQISSPNLPIMQISKDEYDRIASPSSNIQREVIKPEPPDGSEVVLLQLPNNTTIQFDDPGVYKLSTVTIKDAEGRAAEVGNNICGDSVFVSPDNTKLLLLEKTTPGDFHNYDQCTQAIYDIPSKKKEQFTINNTAWIAWIDSETILYAKYRGNYTDNANLWVYDTKNKSEKQLTKDYIIDSSEYSYGNGEKTFIFSPNRSAFSFANFHGVFLVDPKKNALIKIASDKCIGIDPYSEEHYKKNTQNIQRDFRKENLCESLKWSYNSKYLYLIQRKVEEYKSEPWGEKRLRLASENYWKIDLSSYMPTSTSIPLPPSSKPQDTWITHENNILEFSFMYPANWTLSTNALAYKGEDTYLVTVLDPNPREDNGWDISITYYNNPQKLTLKALEDKYTKIIGFPSYIFTSPKEKDQKILLPNNLFAYTYDCTVEGSERDCQNYVIPYETKVVQIRDKEKQTKEHVKNMHQLLSTTEFIEYSDPLKIKHWNTYTNTTFNYLIKYPATWLNATKYVNYSDDFHKFTDTNPMAQGKPSLSVRVWKDLIEKHQYHGRLSPKAYFDKLYSLSDGALALNIKEKYEKKLYNEKVSGVDAVVAEIHGKVSGLDTVAADMVENVGEPIHHKNVFIYKEPYLYEITISQLRANGTEEPFNEIFKTFYQSFTVLN